MLRQNLLSALLMLVMAGALIMTACTGTETTITQTATETASGPQTMATITKTVTETVTATPATEIAVGEEANGELVACNVGDVVKVSLPSNPSTGHAWLLEDKSLDYNVLEQVGESQYEPGATLPGAPGTQIVRFKAVGPGQANINLLYTAPWESRPPSQTFSIQVNVAVGSESDGKQVATKAGNTLRVRLSANPSTGYTWEPVELDTNLLRKVGSTEFVPESDRIGASGYQILRFEALRAGRTTLKLSYVRPTESGPPAKTFSVQVVILDRAATTTAEPVTPTPPLIGGGCRYTDIPGVATIVSIKDADPTAFNCKDAVEAIFDFVPDNPAAAGSYRFPNWSDKGQHLTVGGGMNPPRQWVAEVGLKEGSQLRCVRSEIATGTCTPVNFSFPDLDMSGWTEYCF